MGLAQMKQEEAESLWRKKLVLQSRRVEVFMGYSENPMTPPQSKETGGFLRRAAPSGGPAGRPRTELQIEILWRGLTRRDGPMMELRWWMPLRW
nr:unnamed protein product [Digitaria exilis]